ncbi:MAG: DUF2793 domain-containing protein [Paracoccaceae bacterium]
MSITPRLGLPLLQAAQAQKHVTVNEALVLLDAVGQLSLLSVSITLPPTLANDGDCYGVPVGSVNEWAGRDGEVAIYSNGGWVFVAPQTGWQAWVADQSAPAIFDGTGWVAGAVAMSPSRAASVQQVIEIDHVVVAGTSNTVVGAVPAFSIVFGVTGRVTSALSGTLTGWRLGVAASDNRYGSGLGLAQNSWVRGLTSTPQTYFSDTDLLLTGEGGDFAAGDIRLALHVMSLSIPAV